MYVYIALSVHFHRGNNNSQGSVRIVGYASKAGLGVGRSDSERQYSFCNGRPVDLPRVVKTMNEVIFLLFCFLYFEVWN